MMKAETLWLQLAAVLAQRPFLERLFMASVELAGLAVLAWLAERVVLRRWPRVAALLWVAVMANAVVSVAFDAPFSFTMFSLPAPMRAATENEAARAPAPGWASERVATPAEWEGAAASTSVHSSQGPRWTEAMRTALANPGATLVGAWLAGVGAFALLALRDRLRLWRLIRDAQVPRAEVIRRFSAIAAELGLKNPPRLAATEAIDSPAIAGAVRPVVLVPTWMLDESDPRRLAWALRHELMHAKMADPPVNALSQLMRILYFFHPVAWWAARRWKAAMELACDCALVRSESDVRDYIDTLRTLLTSIRMRRKCRLSCGLFAVRSQLGRRVAALVCMSIESRPYGRAARAGVALFAATGLALGGRFALVPPAQAHGQEMLLWPAREPLAFPPDRSMGGLYIQSMGAMDEAAWEPFQEAQGTAAVPDGVLARLDVSWLGAQDLSPLAAFGPDDIQSLVLRGMPCDASQFRYLDTLDLWELEYRPGLAYGGFADGQAPPQGPGSTLAFPLDRSMGYLYVSTGPRLPEDDTWEPWQEARGVVIVPRGSCVVRLDLSDEAVEDPAPLAALGDNAVDSIVIHRKPATWEALAIFERLSLREIKYQAQLAYGGREPNPE